MFTDMGRLELGPKSGGKRRVEGRSVDHALRDMRTREEWEGRSVDEGRIQDRGSVESTSIAVDPGRSR